MHQKADKRGMLKRNLPTINRKIRADRLQLITHTGENLGVVSRTVALNTAEDAGLDLVIINDNGAEGVPVAKIMDYGKDLYLKKKKGSDAKRNQKSIKIKEVKFSPKIGDHDYQTKINRAVQFMNEGKRVKFTLVFRGREMVTKNEVGRALFDRINESLSEIGSNLVSEQESKLGQFWSKICYLKNK